MMQKFFSLSLKTLIVIGIFTISINAKGSSGIPENLSAAVDEAGRQRMRAYELLKYYLQIQTHNTYGEPAKKLQDAISSYELTQNNLEKYTKNPKTLDALKAVDQVWEKYKKQLSLPCTAASSVELMSKASELKTLSNNAVLTLVQEGKHSGAEEVNIAGLLRAQSQKIASLYLIKSWAGKDADKRIKKDMDQALKVFHDSLDFLDASSKTLSEMKRIIKNMGKTYMYFSVMNNSNVFTPTLVLKKTDIMLKDAVKLVKMYLNKTAK